MTNRIGVVIVIGGGVAGIQCSLDLADSGYKVYLVEKSPAIGGKMMQLDKTFPTNDCATCILAPKLVECGRHPNIELLTLCEIAGISGEEGNFQIRIRKKPRYVDLSKCTACEQCEKVCPVKLSNEFDLGLSFRKAIYSYSPQAVPNAPVIDATNCRYLIAKKCAACQKICPADAINFEEKEEIVEINTGAIILSTGFEQINPEDFKEFGYGRYPNVVTALQFERIINSSGPFLGHLQRLSDEKKPKNIAFLQCIGSRNKEKNYCSAVCCTYATKEAMIIKEHFPDVEVTIYFIDMRVYGKEFEEYYHRARDKYGIKYVRSRPSAIKEDPKTKNLLLTFSGEDGVIKTEEFDLVVLSVGMKPASNFSELAGILGIELNEYGFFKTDRYSPIETSRKGVYISGFSSEPKDVAESVTQGSAAAGLAGALLHSGRGTLVKEKVYPPEIDVSLEEPRVGVFICHCGNNIAGVVDIKSLREYAEKLDNVVLAVDLKYACAQDGLEKIIQMIKENKLNRIVVAACSPRTHEPLFRESMRKSGLNQFLFTMANIRNQCSWVHSKEKDKATEKSKILIGMSVARSSNLEPLSVVSLPLTKRALILGAGVAGMTAALNLSDQGYEIVLVEKENEPGGLAKKIHYDLWEKRPVEFVNELTIKVKGNTKINLLTNAELIETSGCVGNFKSKIKQETKNSEVKEIIVEHGVIVVATGGQEYQGNDYGYGKIGNVISQLELEEKLIKDGINFKRLERVVMIQCVGTRTKERPYCSRVCCGEAIKNALWLKEKNPSLGIIILYKDIMTYGFLEKYYTGAREKGVLFIRYDDDSIPEIGSGKQGKIEIKIIDVETRSKFLVLTDLLVLSKGIVPSMNNEKLSQILKIPLTKQGFYEEAHPKLRPVEFATEGLFLCGLAHTPRYISEVISQANAVAGKAGIILSQKELLVGGSVAVVDQEKCIACLTCVRVCPFQVPVINEKGVAQIEVANCYGCGICVGACPAKAIRLKHYEDKQIIPEIEVLFQEIRK